MFKNQIKLFFILAIIAVLIGSIVFFQEGPLQGIIVTSIVLFFIFISVVITGIDEYKTKKELPTHKYKDPDSVSQYNTIEIPFSYEKTFKLCSEIADLISKKIEKEDSSSGEIIAKTPASWKGWGEKIKFKITKLKNSKTKVKVSSEPLLRTTLCDSGKNLQNVEKVIRFLEKHKNI